MKPARSYDRPECMPATYYTHVRCRCGAVETRVTEGYVGDDDELEEARARAAVAQAVGKGWTSEGTGRGDEHRCPRCAARGGEERREATTYPALHDLIASGARGWHRVAPMQDPTTERWVHLGEGAIPTAVVHGHGSLGAVWWRSPTTPCNESATWASNVDEAKAQAVP